MIRAVAIALAITASSAHAGAVVDPTPLATARANLGPDGDPVRFWESIDTADDIPGRAQRGRIDEVLFLWTVQYPLDPHMDEVLALSRLYRKGRTDDAGVALDALLASVREEAAARRREAAASILERLQRLARDNDAAFWPSVVTVRDDAAQVTTTADDVAAYTAGWRAACVTAVDAAIASPDPAPLDRAAEGLDALADDTLAAVRTRVETERTARAERAAERAEDMALDELERTLPDAIAARRWIDVTDAIDALLADGRPVPMPLGDAEARCVAQAKAALGAGKQPVAQWLVDAVIARCTNEVRPERPAGFAPVRYRVVVDDGACGFLEDLLRDEFAHRSVSAARITARVDGTCAFTERKVDTTEQTQAATTCYSWSFNSLLAYPCIAWVDVVIHQRVLDVEVDAVLELRAGETSTLSVPLTVQHHLEESSNDGVGSIPERRWSTLTLAAMAREDLHPLVAASAEGVRQLERDELRDRLLSELATARARAAKDAPIEVWVLEAWIDGQPSDAFAAWLEANLHVAWWQI